MRDTIDTNGIRELFVKYLTEDSKTKDRRKKEFNQAIFMENGKQVFNGTSLDMVLEKFDKTTKEYKNGGGRK